MGVFTKKGEGGLLDVIRCDEPSYLIWKWHPQGSIAGQNKRENAIRWGSSVRVKETEVAAFVYTKGNGKSIDFIEGPIDGYLRTSNLPGLINILGLAYDGKSPFQAEIYFINLAEVIQTKFAVPFFDVFDPRFADYSVPVVVRGTITFKIKDYRTFVKKHSLSSFTIQQLQAEIKDFLSNTVKGVVANSPSTYNIPAIQIERQITAIESSVYGISKTKLEDQYGIFPTSIDIATIEIDKTSDGYHHLMQVTQEISTARIHAQAQADIRNIQEMQQINIEHARESLRIEREESQYAQHIQTQSANILAHQLNQQAEVGIAGANALGQMGVHGAAEIHDGSLNPVGMMTGMAMGGAIGKNIASMIGGMMNDINQPQAPKTPPPVDENSSFYYVAISGTATGPFSVAQLAQMAKETTFLPTTLVWKPGLKEWVTAQTIPELVLAFNATMPPIPPQT